MKPDIELDIGNIREDICDCLNRTLDNNEVGVELSDISISKKQYNELTLGFEDLHDLDEIITYNDEISQVNSYKIDVRKSNEMILTIVVSTYRDNLYIDDIMIWEKYRGRGIGSKLMQSIVKNCNSGTIYIYCANSKMAYIVSKKENFERISGRRPSWYRKKV